MWDIHFIKTMAEYYKNCLIIEKTHISKDIELIAKIDKVINYIDKILSGGQVTNEESKIVVKIAADIMAQRNKRYAKTEQEKQMIEFKYEQFKATIDNIKIQMQV